MWNRESTIREAVKRWKNKGWLLKEFDPVALRQADARLFEANPRIPIEEITPEFAVLLLRLSSPLVVLDGGTTLPLPTNFVFRSVIRGESAETMNHPPLSLENVRIHVVARLRQAERLNARRGRKDAPRVTQLDLDEFKNFLSLEARGNKNAPDRLRRDSTEI